MAEPKEEIEKWKSHELESKKNLSLMLSIWAQTKMERDKTLVTLSSAAIGLLITLITTVGINNWSELAIVSIAIFSFGVCIFTSLAIYELNSKRIESEIRNTSDKTVNLEKFDKRSIRAFFIGASFFIAFGISNSIDFIIEKEARMSGDNKILIEKDPVPKTLSLDGIGALNPEASGEQEDNDSSRSEESSESNSED